MSYLVAVRALCEFVAKHGDLDLRFTPTPSAQEGIAGHAIVASRRGPDYEPEVTLEGSYQELRVRGRADGYDPVANVLEEVKTFRGDLHAMADNRRALHWAQAKIYGHLLCRARSLPQITLSLVYFDVASLNETPMSGGFEAAELQTYFESMCARFLVWARQELAHRSERDTALTTLAFPHSSFRTGQRELAEAVYKTSQSGGCLMAQATTGIGKTVGTLFPLLKAMPRQRLDKLYFLAAKTPGRQLALDALSLLQTGSAGASPLPLRVLELVARDKACEHPDKACHGDSCPLAKGFYDRLPQARTAAVQLTRGAMLPRTALRQVALTHHVCPYYLSQELVRWADVVVGDYNYYFDNSAMLHTLATTYQWRVAVLVDEAHNLLNRARSMYTATLNQAQLQQVYAGAPAALRPALQRLNRMVAEVHQTQVAPYVVLSELPASLLKTLQQTLTQLTDFLLANPTRVDGDLQAFYFEALHFSRMADVFGGHSLLDVTLATAAPLHTPEVLAAGHDCAVLTIRNVVPAPHLASRFTDAQSVVLFSATLSPPEFYKNTLGLPAATHWLDVPSPFAATQLRVVAVNDISTRFQHRTQSLQPIADLMARQYAKQPGNYLVFLSSYDYLQKLQRVLAARHPLIAHWMQSREMDEAARSSFLSRFTDTSCGIGFAVLGGAFAEGIDLPGDRLIGAFIATLGLPQVNEVNEQMRARLSDYFAELEGSQAPKLPVQETLVQAYNYTYLFPGLQKVVQAAGRVIRTTSDRGVVFLMDDRFNRPDVAALLPSWWHVETMRVGRSAFIRSKNTKQHQQQDHAEGDTK
ncbi:MAG: ATP-dependent DNA helicase [Polaromonas sp.]|nr:ATP-dependent DNA helicase [Polaromonas sp.]